MGCLGILAVGRWTGRGTDSFQGLTGVQCTTVAQSVDGLPVFPLAGTDLAKTSFHRNWPFRSVSYHQSPPIVQVFLFVSSLHHHVSRYPIRKIILSQAAVFKVVLSRFEASSPRAVSRRLVLLCLTSFVHLQPPFVRFSPHADFLGSRCFWVFSCHDHHPDFHSTLLPVRRVRSRPAFTFRAFPPTQTGRLGPFCQPRKKKKKRSTRSLRLFPPRHQRLDPPDVLPITTDFAGVSSGRCVSPFFSFDDPTTSQTDRPSAVTVDDCSTETNNGLFPFSWPQASFNSTVSPTVEGFLLQRPPISPLEDRQVRDLVASVLPLPHFQARNRQLRGVATPRAWSG
jgi:hypothetical protein